MGIQDFKTLSSYDSKNQIISIVHEEGTQKIELIARSKFLFIDIFLSYLNMGRLAHRTIRLQEVTQILADSLTPESLNTLKIHETDIYQVLCTLANKTSNALSNKINQKINIKIIDWNRKGNKNTTCCIDWNQTLTKQDLLKQLRTQYPSREICIAHTPFRAGHVPPTTLMTKEFLLFEQTTISVF